MRVFLARHHVGVTTLAQLAGVHHSILVRVLNGTRSDMTSDNADNVRDAMRRYEAMHDVNRQDGETTLGENHDRTVHQVT